MNLLQIYELFIRYQYYFSEKNKKMENYPLNPTHYPIIFCIFATNHIRSKYNKTNDDLC